MSLITYEKLKRSNNKYPYDLTYYIFEEGSITITIESTSLILLNFSLFKLSILIEAPFY